MHEDILNAIYIESKHLGLTQTMFTIFTEVDELDGAKEGHIDED